MTPYDVITARIVSQLEAGTVPWRRPWGGRFRFPRNLVSGKQYRGVNVFLLSAASYASPYWLTYKQAQELGGNVRKGERAMPVVFWKMLDHKDAETGEDGKIPLLRYYSAFNVAQCDGLPADRIADNDVSGSHPFAPIAACERVVADWTARPTIEHGFDKACYVPAKDEVRMPNQTAFEQPAGYYATLFHELGHATGHPTRLKRPGIADVAAFGSDTYGREELVAEMTSAFLCGHTGIETATLENSAAYLAGWLRTIRQDARLIVTAAAQAQKAADCILGRTFGAETEGGAQ